MTTNKNYQICSAAIAAYQSQKFQTLQEACREYKADYQLAMIMLNNEKALEQEMVDSDVFESRMISCSHCDKNINNICNECACPVSFITNIKFKSCPIGKW